MTPSGRSTKFGWADAIRTWDVDFLRDNPLAQFYLGPRRPLLGGRDRRRHRLGRQRGGQELATMLKWAPYAAAGIAVIGLTAGRRRDEALSETTHLKQQDAPRGAEGEEDR
jgi:hypothetical protein